jgi:hypothetical protein
MRWGLQPIICGIVGHRLPRPAPHFLLSKKLVLDGRAGTATIWRSPREGEDVERLVVDQRTALT